MFARLLLIASAAVAAAATSAQPAAPWPAQTVRIVVPSPAGSGIDYVPRLLADRLEKLWGQPVVVENKPGANSIIGTEFVARAAPDGHTLLFASDATFTVLPHLYARLPFDAQRDFVPITQVITFNNLLVAHPSVAAGSLPELIAFAKAHPGRLTYATIGAGSVSHMLSEWLSHQARIEMLHVPYKGIPQATAAVLSGESDLTWAGVFTTQAHIQAGKLRPVAIAAPRRAPALPDVPTFAELGYPGIDYTLWFGLFAPAGTPRAVVERIQRDVARVLADPDVRDVDFRPKGWEVSGNAPAEFAALIRRDLDARAAIVKVSGARVD